MEHQDWLGSIIASRITLLMILQTFMEQLILIWHLTHHESHSLDAVPHSSLSQVIDHVIFPFISYFSHDESLCFILLLILFLIYHLIHHAVLRWNFLEYFSDSFMSNHLQIPEMSLSSAFFSKVLSSTVLIAASGLVITSQKGLNHLITLSECALLTSSSLLQCRSQRIR